MHQGVRRSLQYGVAVAAVAVAVVSRLLLDPVLGPRLPFVTMFGAVAATVWFGGWRPALLATAIGYIAAARFFIAAEPGSPLIWSSSGAIAGLAMYLYSCLIIVFFGDGMRSARRIADAKARESLARQEQLEREIADRKQAQEALKEAHRRKDEFLAILAHELRNPLAPIRNALGILRLADGRPEAVERARDLLERQLSQVVRIVDDLLDLSRISTGRIELRKEPMDLAAAMKSAVEAWRPIIESSGRALTVSLPPEAIFVQADLTRLVQVVGNLLSNACKYTERGGSISLAAEREGDEGVVRVRDDGIGIPQEMLDKVFEMFTQVDRSLERSQGGLGVGLTLVRRLVEMHGGTVSAHSDGQGRGSELVVRLPALSRPPRPRHADQGHDGPAAGVQRRVLVADDNRDAADSLCEMLTLLGSDVHAAYDGQQAVEQAASLQPDVVVMDLAMPRMNGYEAARQIRARPGNKRMVLIAMTGWGDDEDRRRSKAAGFDFHLVKPVDLDSLQDLLSRD